MAVTLAGLPTSASDLLAASQPSAPFVQDTTRARQDTARARDPERRPDPEQAPQDSVAADTLPEPGEPFPDPDSVMRELLERPGYRPVLYRGDTLQFFTDEGRIHVNQRAHIERVQSFDPKSKKEVIGAGLPASPGAAT